MEAGSVQGVVVQIMVETCLPARAGSIFAGSLVSRYFTQTLGLVWLEYSISASAKRSLVMDAPVHRTQAFIDSAIFHEIKQLAHDHRLILRRHGGIRLLPAAKDAQALELVALDVEIFFRVLAAFFADGDRPASPASYGQAPHPP